MAFARRRNRDRRALVERRSKKKRQPAVTPQEMRQRAALCRHRAATARSAEEATRLEELAEQLLHWAGETEPRMPASRSRDDSDDR